MVIIIVIEPRNSCNMGILNNIIACVGKFNGIKIAYPCKFCYCGIPAFNHDLVDFLWCSRWGRETIAIVNSFDCLHMHADTIHIIIILFFFLLIHQHWIVAQMVYVRGSISHT